MGASLVDSIKIVTSLISYVATRTSFIVIY